MFVKKIYLKNHKFITPGCVIFLFKHLNIVFVVGRAGPPGPLVQVHLLGGAVLPQGREGGQRPCAAGKVHQNVQGMMLCFCS